MFGKSLLTDHGNLLMDFVIMSLVIVIPALIVSLRLVKRDRNFVKHRNIQTGLFIVLVFAVSLFEYDMKMQGGIWEATKFSPWTGTAFLKWTVYVHLFFAFSTSWLWIFLIPFSHYIYRKSFAPNRFTKVHKVLGWIGMCTMLGTGTTGAFLYYIGFNS